MKRFGVLVLVLGVAVGFSLDAAANDKEGFADLGAWLDVQDGGCAETQSSAEWGTVATAKSPCYVENNCPNGAPTISCTGTSYCTAGYTCYTIPYVECDGVRTLCSRDWCTTKLCCTAYKVCDDYCQSQGLGDIGGCYQGCCECPEP